MLYSWILVDKIYTYKEQVVLIQCPSQEALGDSLVAI